MGQKHGSRRAEIQADKQAMEVLEIILLKCMELIQTLLSIAIGLALAWLFLIFVQPSTVSTYQRCNLKPMDVESEMKDTNLADNGQPVQVMESGLTTDTESPSTVPSAPISNPGIEPISSQPMEQMAAPMGAPMMPPSAVSTSGPMMAPIGSPAVSTSGPMMAPVESPAVSMNAPMMPSVIQAANSPQLSPSS